jgi:hypothetical protein
METVHPIGFTEADQFEIAEAAQAHASACVGIVREKLAAPPAASQPPVSRSALQDVKDKLIAATRQGLDEAAKSLSSMGPFQQVPQHASDDSSGPALAAALAHARRQFSLRSAVEAEDVETLANACKRLCLWS